MMSIKAYLYGGITLFLVAGIGGLFVNYHYIPIRELEKQVVRLEKQLKVTGSALNTCEMNLTKEKLQTVIDTLGEQNETIIIDFNNAWD